MTTNVVRSVFTFNGAGVGSLNLGQSLTDVISTFSSMRALDESGGCPLKHLTAEDISLYQQVESRARCGALTNDDVQSVYQQLFNVLNFNYEPGRANDLQMLYQATQDSKYISGEISRVANLSPTIAVQPNATDIAALGLAYRIGVIEAASHVSAVSAGTGYTAGTFLGTPNYWDVSSIPTPSAVALSQIHLGSQLTVRVEDQPLYRGNVIADAVYASFREGGIKLLVNDYDSNDFGDTHSIVLLVDSLRVRSLMEALDPSMTDEQFQQLFEAAANTRGVSVSGTQGRCEGDALENLVNLIAQGLGVRLSTTLNGNTDGNTWANIDSRNALWNAVSQIESSSNFSRLAGRVRLTCRSIDAVKALDDFSAAAAVAAVAPVYLEGVESAAQEMLCAALRNISPEFYGSWIAVKEGRPDSEITKSWFADRATMRDAVLRLNNQNSENRIVYNDATNPPRFYSNSAGLEVIEAPQSTVINIPDAAVLRGAAEHILFAPSGGCALLTGAEFRDHLYGSDGVDFLKGLGGGDLLLGGRDADVLDGGAGQDTLVGGAGNDWLGYTSVGLGNESQDEIGSDGNTYDGGFDNDRISGSNNKDRYIFRKGDGVDYVQTHGGADELQLIANADFGNGTQAEITADQVTFQRDGMDLLVCVSNSDGSSGGQVRIATWFDSGASANALGSVTLRSEPDGTVFRTWTQDEIQGIALNAIGSEQGETLTGLTNYRNVLQGRGGNDKLLGANGAVASTALGDTFIGGAGDDEMTGTGSGDTYIYSRGDGHDTLREQNDSMAFQDEVVFLDISSEEVGFTRLGNDLKVVLPSNGSITVKDWFLASENRQVEFMSFTDQRLSAAEVTQRVTSPALEHFTLTYDGTEFKKYFLELEDGSSILKTVYNTGKYEIAYRAAPLDYPPAKRVAVLTQYFSADGTFIKEGEVFEDGSVHEFWTNEYAEFVRVGFPHKDLFQVHLDTRSYDQPFYVIYTEAWDSAKAQKVVNQRFGFTTSAFPLTEEALRALPFLIYGVTPESLRVARDLSGSVLIGSTAPVDWNSPYLVFPRTVTPVLKLGDEGGVIPASQIEDAPLLLTAGLGVVSLDQVPESGIVLDQQLSGTGLTAYRDVQGNVRLLGGAGSTTLLLSSPALAPAIQRWDRTSVDTAGLESAPLGLWPSGEPILLDKPVAPQVIELMQGLSLQDEGTGFVRRLNDLHVTFKDGTELVLKNWATEPWSLSLKSQGQELDYTALSNKVQMFDGDASDNAYTVNTATGQTVYGGSGNDTLTGGTGVDILYGDADNDTLRGGAGNDLLFGGTGDDTVEYSQGDGSDVVTEDSGFDTLKVSMTTGSVDRLYRDQSDNLVLRFKDQSTVTVQGHFSSPDKALEKIQFTNTSWDLTALNSANYYLEGTNGPDVLEFGALPGVVAFGEIAARGSGDVLYSSNLKTALLRGGLSSDKIYVKDETEAADVYMGVNEGNDQVYLSSLPSNKVHLFMAGVTAPLTSFTFERVGTQSNTTGVRFKYVGEPYADQSIVTVYNFNLVDAANFQVTFTDAVDASGNAASLTWDKTVLLQHIKPIGTAGVDYLRPTTVFKEVYGLGGDDVLYGDGRDGVLLDGGEGNDTLSGTSAAEVLFGGAGNDTLNAGGGDDILYGGTGADTLNGSGGNDLTRYFVGDGYDTLTDSGGTSDILEFVDADIAAAAFYKVGNDLEVLLAPGQGVLVKNQFVTGGAVEFMLFGGQSYSASQIASLAGPKP